MERLSIKDTDFNDLKEFFYDFIIKRTEKVKFFYTLSEVKKEVLAYKMAGYKTKEIALKLNLAPKTIKWHYHDICNKLDEEFFRRKGPFYQEKIQLYQEKIQQKIILVNLFYHMLLRNNVLFFNYLINKEVKVETKKENILPTGDGNEETN